MVIKLYSAVVRPDLNYYIRFFQTKKTDIWSPETVMQRAIRLTPELEFSVMRKDSRDCWDLLVSFNGLFLYWMDSHYSWSVGTPWSQLGL
eukprot:g47727.t1